MKTAQKKQPEQQQNRIKDFLFSIYKLIFKKNFSNLEKIGTEPPEKSLLHEGLEAYDEAKKLFNLNVKSKEKIDQEMLVFFNKAIECGVQEALTLRAFCLHGMGFHKDAIQDFDNSIYRSKVDPNLYFGRGLAKSNIANYEGAIEDLTLAIELSKIDTKLNHGYNSKMKESGWNSVSQFYESQLNDIIQQKENSEKEAAKISKQREDMQLQLKMNTATFSEAFAKQKKIYDKVGQAFLLMLQKQSEAKSTVENKNKQEIINPSVNFYKWEEWTKIGSRSICIAWNKLPFYHKRSIIWRGITIHAQISDTNSDLGFRKVIVFVINNKIFRFGLGKWKYMVGSIGTPPEIKCQTHSLKIKTDFRAMTLTLTEESLNNIDEMLKNVENQFDFFDTPDNVLFEVPIKIAPVPVDPFRVYLFEDRGNEVCIDCSAYFNEEGLTVEYREMGRRSYYEDEYYITVKRSNLHLVYKEFEIINDEKVELLQAILKSYNDKDCFKNFRTFLELKDIPFDNGVRHD